MNAGANLPPSPIAESKIRPGYAGQVGVRPVAKTVGRPQWITIGLFPRAGC
jgi:hypothetical protein